MGRWFEFPIRQVGALARERRHGDAVLQFEVCNRDGFEEAVHRMGSGAISSRIMASPEPAAVGVPCRLAAGDYRSGRSRG
jgi:hypothetical protein